MNPQLSHITQSSVPVSKKVRKTSKGNTPLIFTDIYKESVNLTYWQRSLSIELNNAVAALLKSTSHSQIALTTSSKQVTSHLVEHLQLKADSPLITDINELVDMFCCLFSLRQVALRLVILTKPMCPKFHVDRVPCRLITTYHGGATEWLPHAAVNRSKLGAGAEGAEDHESGLYNHSSDIQQLNTGDVALLKGELWENNDNAGLVHRSPKSQNQQNRLLLTLDFA